IQTHVYTHRHTYIQTHVRTYTNTHLHTHICTDTHMYIHTHTHTHPHKKLQYFVVHSQIWVLHCKGKQRAQHTMLALLSLRSAIERSDGSQSVPMTDPASAPSMLSKTALGYILAPTIISRQASGNFKPCSR
ncbi:unnamed protein product, partial [Staurois parvus]